MRRLPRASGPSVACGAGGVQKCNSGMGRELSVDLHQISAGDEGIQRWLAGVRWQRRAERALKPLKLTFAQWLVLDAMARLIRQSNDAVSQIQVARHLQMGAPTLCRVMQWLDRAGLVDQAPAFPGPENRIFLTAIGESLARQGRARVDAVSAAWVAEPVCGPSAPADTRRVARPGSGSDGSNSRETAARVGNSPLGPRRLRKAPALPNPRGRYRMLGIARASESDDP